MNKITTTTILLVMASLFMGMTIQADDKKDDGANDGAAQKGKGKGGKGGKGKGEFAARIFEKLDENEDGSLSPKELASARIYQDAGKGEVGKAFKEKDLNGDGKISKPEFLKTMGKGKAKGKGGKPKGKGKG